MIGKKEYEWSIENRSIEIEISARVEKGTYDMISLFRRYTDLSYDWRGDDDYFATMTKRKQIDDLYDSAKFKEFLQELKKDAMNEFEDQLFQISELAGVFEVFQEGEY